MKFEPVMVYIQLSACAAGVIASAATNAKDANENFFILPPGPFVRYPPCSTAYTVHSIAAHTGLDCVSITVQIDDQTEAM